MALAARWRYQVFLSFRGEDTRNSLIGHLYDKLTLKGIYTFKDDRELERGKSISHEIVEAIKDSRISIVVLSQNYASSTWCLDELNEIIQCKENMGQIILPVFYKVNPSDVRKGREGFGKALMEHEEKFKDVKGKVEAWRKALVKVAALSGWHFQDGEEASFIGQIVADILEKVSCATSIVASDLVGMSSHMMEMEQLLSIESNVVRMVGIWGKGGIGKTTIARVVYDKHRTQFTASWFLEDVGIKFKKHGVAFLKEELLSNILKESDLKGWPLDKHSLLIKDRLCKKDVLIVLDNVDGLEQLEVLAKSADWFGPGSRIIITTRNKRVLDAHEVNHIYETKPLGNDAALQLFSRYAFKQNHPKSDYLELSYDFVTYANGLPSALRVLGSSLFNRTTRQWQEELEKLRRQPNSELHNILKMGYDGLEVNEKKVFLDIACFFNGDDKDRVRDILDACGFFPDCAFEVLEDKALLNISNNKLYVDGILRDMAGEIVRQESKELGKRSRLWDPEHINHVLSACMGTKRVEGIFLEPSESKEMQISSKAFSAMCSLRLLKLNKPRDLQHSCNLQLLDEGLEYLSGQLRYLHWHAYPSSSWVPNFAAGYLVELDLPNCNVKQLWTGKQHLVNLKLINLSHSKLTNLPDLSEAKKLKTLNLRGCSNLNKVLYIQHLTELEYIDLSDCSNLEQLSELPRSIKYLYLVGTALEELPESLGYLSACVVLDIRNCSRLQKLPYSIVKLRSLESLDIAGCTNLLKLSSTKCSSMLSAKNFPDYMSPVSDNVICDEVEAPDIMEPNYKIGSKRTKENADTEAAAIPSRQCVRQGALNQEVDGSNLDETNFNEIHPPSRGHLEVDTKPAPESERETFMILENGCKVGLLSKQEAAIESVLLPAFDETAEETQVTGPLTPPIVAKASIIAKILPVSWTISACTTQPVLAQSPSDLQLVSKNMLAKLSTRNGKRVPYLNGARDPELMQRHGNDLAAYFGMSLEAIHEADAFKNIEQIARTLKQHPFCDSTTFNCLIPRVENFKRAIPDTIDSMKAARALKRTIPEKSKELDASLDRGEEQLAAIDGTLSQITEEQDKVENEIQRLLAKKRELHNEKRLVSSQLQKVVAKLSKDMEERDHLQVEIEQAERVLYEGEEQLAQANTSWKLLGQRVSSEFQKMLC